MNIVDLAHNQKMKYFLTSTKKQILRANRCCPSCAYDKSTVIDRKYLVTSLCRCDNCLLQFRVPTTSEEEFASFYQAAYKQGFTTDMPDKTTLNKLLATKFAGTEKDYSEAIKILNVAGANIASKIFDFGCSWGYGSWQFQQAGFDTASFELSRPRAEYAREKLGLLVYSDRNSVSGKYDIFFSSHVLEHLPSVSNAVNLAFEILKPGRLFVALTPNGSTGYRSVNPHAWHRMWGYVHPNLLDEQYYKHVTGCVATGTELVLSV